MSSSAPSQRVNWSCSLMLLWYWIFTSISSFEHHVLQELYCCLQRKVKFHRLISQELFSLLKLNLRELAILFKGLAISKKKRNGEVDIYIKKRKKKKEKKRNRFNSRKQNLRKAMDRNHWQRVRCNWVRCTECREATCACGTVRHIHGGGPALVKMLSGGSAMASQEIFDSDAR